LRSADAAALSSMFIRDHQITKSFLAIDGGVPELIEAPDIHAGNAGEKPVKLASALGVGAAHLAPAQPRINALSFTRRMDMRGKNPAFS
jgi:hypothetical protein